MFGIDLRSPTEAALLPANPVSPSDIDDNQEEIVLSLASAQKIAVANIREAQRGYRSQYDKGVKQHSYRV